MGKRKDTELLQMRDYAVTAGTQIIGFVSSFIEQAYQCANNGNAKGLRRKIQAMRKSVNLLFDGFDQNFGGGHDGDI